GVATLGMLYGLDGGAEQVLDMQRLAGLGPAPCVPQSPPAEIVDDRTEVGAGLGEAVPDLAPARLAVGGREAGGLEFAQALGERLGRDAAKPFHQIGEPLRAGGQVTDHEQGPPVADQLKGARDLAEVVVRTDVPHHDFHTSSLVILSWR